jgi:hypothetical protein
MERKLDHRDRLIQGKLVERMRNGGTSAREIHREVRGAIPQATIQRHLNRMKAEGLADQRENKKWVPGPKLLELWEGVLGEELGKAHVAIPITVDRNTIRLMKELLGSKKKVETFIVSADNSIEITLDQDSKATA